MAVSGDWFSYPGDGGDVKVLAVADGYCMCRKPGKLPFVFSERDVDPLVFDRKIENQNRVIRDRANSR